MSDQGPVRHRGSQHGRRAPQLNRREFLRDIAATTAAAAGVVTLGYLAYSDDPVRWHEEAVHHLPDFRVEPSAMHPVLAVVRGVQAEPMVREAVAHL